MCRARDIEEMEKQKIEREEQGVEREKQEVERRKMEMERGSEECRRRGKFRILPEKERELLWVR